VCANATMSFPLMNVWNIMKLEATSDWDAPVTDSLKVCHATALAWVL
jgi:hypothetical protein